MKPGAFLAAILCLGAGTAIAQDDPSVISESGNEAFFRSPSGNIWCAITAGDGVVAECYLRRFTPAPQLAAQGCAQAWGFFVDHQGVGRAVCTDPSFVMMQQPKVLDYGRWVTFAGVTCRSERTGMTCTNGNGRGFSVARATQSLF